jgi:hypothetical protein
MTSKELAALLTGSEYPLEVPQVLKAFAQAYGLVIVCGASDDLWSSTAPSTMGSALGNEGRPSSSTR